ncbi:ARPP-2 domain-containing protein [Streptomyces araujoniae]|uniref:ARPP-2 domain-containing protein n=1 Tax=Streptomyces sp. ZEA17I TaxID=2202516 RepID=UPI00215B57EA|nr:hypothetical protein [Streptomyces sp. ZEA17I]
MNTSEGLADLVAAEDVLLFVNAAITATGQREFRPGVSGATDHRLSLDFLHTYVRPWCTSTPYTTPGDSTYGGWRPGFRRPGSGTRRLCPGQCGVMVYVSDALAAAFVVPHPEDYRLPHASLVEDLFGELVHQYGLYGAPVAEFGARIRGEEHIRTLAGLRVAARGRERAWEEAHDRLFARRLLNTSYGFERVYRMGSFTLWRFLPPFVRDGSGQRIGETVTGHKGQVACLKTFRLSDARVRRGHLLHTLAVAEWELSRAAGVLGTSREELVRRIRTAGFSQLLKGNAQTGAQSGERAESNVGREPTRWPF